MVNVPFHMQNGSLATYFNCGNTRAGQGINFSPNGAYILRWGYGHDIVLLASLDASVIHTFSCGSGSVRTASWSSDSRYLLASTDTSGNAAAAEEQQSECKLYVWDVEKRVCRSELGTGAAAVIQCALSPDASKVLSVDEDGVAKLWDLDTRTAVRTFDIARPVHSVQFADGGRTAVMAMSDDAGVSIVALKEEDPEAALKLDGLEAFEEFRDKVSYTFSRNGAWMLAYLLETVTSTNVVRLNTTTLEQFSLQASSGNLTHAEFVGEGLTWVLCGRDNDICIYDTATSVLLQTLRGHTVDVMYCRVCPDMKYAISGDSDGNLLCWDLASSTFHMRMKSHTAPIAFCDITTGAQRGLSVDVEGQAYVWNLDAKATLDVLRTQSDSLCCLESVPNRKQLLVGYQDGTVKLFDSQRLSPLWQHTRHASTERSCYSSAVLALAVSPDGRLAASSGCDGTVFVAAMESGAIKHELRDHEEAVVGLRFTADGRELVSAGRDSRVCVWKTDDAKLLQMFEPDGRPTLSCLAVSTEDDIIGVTTRCGRLLLWISTTGHLTADVAVAELGTSALAFSPDGRLAAVGVNDGSTHVLSVPAGHKLHVLVGNAAPVHNLYFTNEANGGRLVSVCARQSITWDLRGGRQDRHVADFILDGSGLYANSSFPERVFVAHNGMSVYDPLLKAAIFDTQECDKPPGNSHLFRSGSHMVYGASSPLIMYAPPRDTVVMLAPESAGCRALDFSSDGLLLVSGSMRGELALYDVQQRQPLGSWLAHRRCAITCVKFTNDSSAVYSCAEDCKVILWDWRTRSSIAQLLGHHSPVVSVEMSLDGSVMASGDKEGMVIVWDTKTKVPRKIFPVRLHNGPVLCCSMSPDGTKVASSGEDEHIVIVDSNTGRQVACLDDALDGQGLTIKFSFDGTRVMVGSERGELLVWDIAQNCLLYDIPAHDGSVYDAAWSGDSRRLLSVGSDGRARVWDTAAGSQICDANFERGFGVIESGGFIKCDISATGDTMAGVTGNGTFVLWDIAGELRKSPDGSMVYEWLATMPVSAARETFALLLAENPLLVNLQDSRGWTILMHSAHNSNPQVTKLILDLVKPNCGMLGYMSSPVITSQSMFTASGVAPTDAPAAAPSTLRSMREDTMLRSTVTLNASGKPSSTVLIAKPLNVLDVALAANNADCVQHLLDAVLAEKVTAGSYLAITLALAKTAPQYPEMCQAFLTSLPLRVLGDIEIPSHIAARGTQVALHSSYSSYKELWQEKLNLDMAEKGPMAVMEAAMVRLPFAARSGKRSVLSTLVDSDVPVDTFGSETVKAIILYKWRAFAQRQIYTKAIVYFLFTTCFTVFAVLFSQDDTIKSPSEEGATDASPSEYAAASPPDDITASLADYAAASLPGLFSSASDRAATAFSIFLFIMGAYYMLQEVRQLVKLGVRAYFDSFWNFVDIIAYLFTMIIMPCYWARYGLDTGGFVPILIALETILLWIKQLFFALAIDGLGTFVFMTIEIVKGIHHFIILLLVLFLSFAVAFLVLFRFPDPDGWNDNYSNFGEAMLWSYVTIFSNIDPRQPLDTEYGTFSTILYVGYTFILVVIMVNMLIALMADIYSRVKVKQNFVFLQGRAELIIEVESTMSRGESHRQRNVSPYLHILAPAKRVLQMAGEEDANGNRPDMSNIINTLLDKIEAHKRADMGLDADGDAGARSGMERSASRVAERSMTRVGTTRAMAGVGGTTRGIERSATTARAADGEDAASLAALERKLATLSTAVEAIMEQLKIGPAHTRLPSLDMEAKGSSNDDGAQSVKGAKKNAVPKARVTVRSLSRLDQSADAKALVAGSPPRMSPGIRRSNTENTKFRLNSMRSAPEPLPETASPGSSLPGGIPSPREMEQVAEEVVSSPSNLIMWDGAEQHESMPKVGSKGRVQEPLVLPTE